MQKVDKEELDKIVSTYFRPKRVAELMQQNSFRDLKRSQAITSLNRVNSGLIGGMENGRGVMSKTWSGGASFQNIVQNRILDDCKS